MLSLMNYLKWHLNKTGQNPGFQEKITDFELLHCHDDDLADLFSDFYDEYFGSSKKPASPSIQKAQSTPLLVPAKSQSLTDNSQDIPPPDTSPSDSPISTFESTPAETSCSTPTPKDTHILSTLPYSEASPSSIPNSSTSSTQIP